MKYKKIVFMLFIGLFSNLLFSYETQEIKIYSKAMDKSPNATVILPKSYGKTNKKYPVVYMLHGWTGDNKNFTYYDKEIGKLADLYDLILVMADGNFNKWYFDSTVNSKYQYGTYVGKEIPEYIDKNYKTIKNRSARAITGYSMGGFGAFNAVMNYPETFGNLGSMSGSVDLEKYHTKWNIEKIFGEEADWGKIAVKNNLYKILDKKVNIIFGCGTGDDFITINRELHEKMTILDIPHTYIERPGKHDWDYWRTELEFQLLYFSKYLS